jgi:hypothetical protein
VKRRPVVGGVVSGEPRAEVAARWIVSTVSVAEQVEPATRIPDRHSTTMIDVPIKIVPVRSIPAGFKML